MASRPIPTRALALLDRSVRARAKRSATGGSAPSRSPRASGSGRSQGEPLEALAGYRDVIDTWFRGGDWANQWLSLRYVFAILESLGRDEAAAMLYGALEAAGVMQALPLEPSNADEFGHAVERLSARLDPGRVRRRGRTRPRARATTRSCATVLREIDACA